MAISLTKRDFWKDFDWALLGVALALSAISLLEVYSATKNVSSNIFLLRQLAWVGVGMVGMFVMASFDYHTLCEHIPWIYIASVLTLVYTLVLGHTVNGSKSWIMIGPAGFQPSEMIKVVVILTLARYVSDLRNSRFLTIPQIFKAGLISGLPMLLVLLQPDLGTALTYLPAFAFIVFIRGVRPVVLVSLILGFVMLLPVSWMFLKDYQKDRIRMFVNPEEDPLGAGYHVIQSEIAIGSGGFWGKGLFKGSQNQLGFLPTRHTDFIFSVVGEELGFAGVVTTLGLLAFILFRAVRNAQTSRDSLGLFIAMGLVGTYFFHMVVNIGMVIHLMPITGIPLPFLSYGGSSILAAFLGLGLLISVRRSRYVN
jgi:rod shape determining protein RodA